MDATWHLGPRGSATQAHAAPTRRYIYFIIIITIYSIKFFSLPYIGRGFRTLLIVRSYEPNDLLYSFTCGTNPHVTYYAGDVDAYGTSDRWRD